MVCNFASRLRSGLSINSSGLISGTVGGSASTDSPYVMSVTASVSGVPSVTDTFQLNVPVDGLATPADQTSTEGASVTLDLASTQSSGQTFVAAGLPAGLSINSSTGAITGTIAAGSAGSYTVDVGVTYDGTTNMTSFAWTVNPAIAFAGTADQTNTVSNYVSFGVSASDTYSGTLSYSIAGQPAGVSINSSSGTISGTISSGPRGLTPSRLPPRTELIPAAKLSTGGCTLRRIPGPCSPTPGRNSIGPRTMSISSPPQPTRTARRSPSAWKDCRRG